MTRNYFESPTPRYKHQGIRFLARYHMGLLVTTFCVAYVRSVGALPGISRLDDQRGGGGVFVYALARNTAPQKPCSHFEKSSPTSHQNTE